MAKSLMEFKTWSNSVVADDQHLVSLDGTVLKLTRNTDPETVLAELEMAEVPPVVEDAPLMDAVPEEQLVVAEAASAKEPTRAEARAARRGE